MMHDSIFYVWESGPKLSRFDGYEFEKVDSIPFLPYLVSSSFELKKGTVFFHDSLHYYTNKKFFSISPKLEYYRNDYYVVDHKLFFVGIGKVYSFDESERTWKFEFPLRKDVSEWQDKWKENFDFYEFQGNQFFWTIEGKTMNIYQVKSDTIEKLHSTDSHFHRQNRVSISNLTSTSKTTLEIVNRPLDHEYGQSWKDNDIYTSLSTNDQKTYLIKGDEDSIFVLGKITTSKFLHHELNDQSIFLSAHSGLERINPNILYFDFEETNMVDAMHTIFEDANGRIWFGSYGNGFSYFENNELYRFPKYSSYRLMPGAILHSDGFNYLFTENAHRGLHKFKNSVLTSIPIDDGTRTYSGYLVREFPDGSTAFGLNRLQLGLSDDISGVPHNIKFIGEDKGINLDNVLAIEQDSAGRYWMGRPSTGIAMYDMMKDMGYTWKRNASDPSTFGAISMEIDTIGNLWMGTNKGIMFLEDPNTIQLGDTSFYSRTRLITLPNGDHSLTTFLLQVDEFLVAGNSSGVHFIDLNSFYKNENNPLIYQLIYGEDIHGGGSEQNCILFDAQRRFWIGSQEGASMIKWDDFQFDTTTNRIRLKEVKAGTKDLTFSHGIPIVLPKDNRNTKIRFGPEKNPSMLKNIFFDYYLINKRKDTIASKKYDQNGVFEMAYVPPGNYRLLIEARKHGQLMDTETIILKAPLSLSENPVFWVGLCLLLGAGIGGFFMFRSQQKRQLLEKDLKLSKLDNERNALQIQAIISSFNPHFINNSLHWVQSRYNEDPKMVKLVDRLSKNIQYIFANTRKGKAYHTLNEEINLVKNYFTIQQLRFDDDIELRLPSISTLDKFKDFPILLMQIQIHVENAIEHGLRNRIGSRYVEIKLRETNESIIIEVIDDGAGRKKATQIKSQGTQSGTNMLQELHNIFNTNNHFKIKTEYEDDIFIDEKTRLSYGTKVILTLPKYFYYDFKQT